MVRAIQGLEDLHHGFPVERVGQRHRGFAFETVTGVPAITWGDFEGVLPSHLLMLDTVALTFLGITLVDGLQRLCSKALSSPSPARITHSLRPYVGELDDALPIDAGTHHDNIGNRAITPFGRGKIF
ncbi:hypothetical protein C1C92_22390 [Aeromonas caviae]|uniref:hypothetical protein n=1 Tax=Aeromonas caviae TaxID=648 RepID=UPI0013AEA3BD|nr:hypothetical protein [Aeromonas caviae]QLI59451.1 hypothetical protein C1C92_22390 [Aeromonas caviae]UBS67663.1 hypothetical protein LCG53_12310 [Aeromonas caviae]